MIGESYTLRIDPDGSITALYDDNLPFINEGTKTAWRASDVEWSDADQGWRVHFRPPFADLSPKESFKTREDAIRREVELLNELLARVGIPGER